MSGAQIFLQPPHLTDAPRAGPQCPGVGPPPKPSDRERFEPPAALPFDCPAARRARNGSNPLRCGDSALRCPPDPGSVKWAHLARARRAYRLCPHPEQIGVPPRHRLPAAASNPKRCPQSIAGPWNCPAKPEHLPVDIKQLVRKLAHFIEALLGNSALTVDDIQTNQEAGQDQRRLPPRAPNTSAPVSWRDTPNPPCARE